MKKCFSFIFVVAAGLSLFLNVQANGQSFVEGFDSPAMPASTTTGNGLGGESVVLGSGTWHAQNISTPIGTSGWFTNTTVFAPQAGTGQLNSNFNNVAGANTINNFFMSPVRTFQNGDTISFFTRTVDVATFPDRLRLVWSGSGASTDPADFTTTLLSVNDGLTTAGYPTTYTQFTAVVSGLGAPTSGRFAFNYNVTSGGPSGSNSDFIGIDTVAYSAIPEPTSALALMGLCVATVLRRRRS